MKLSGIRPTGVPHWGNYFGALSQPVDMLLVADLHAMDNISAEAIDFLQYLILPGNPKLILQSGIVNLLPNFWKILTKINKSYLDKAPSFKDALAKQIPVNMGVYTYPLLQAADIITLGASDIFVGPDQLAHIELARYVAKVFKKPSFISVLNLSTSITGSDGLKMSKSLNNYLALNATESEIKNYVYKIKTDSTPYGVAKDFNKCSVYKLLTFFVDDITLHNVAEQYIQGTALYKNTKDLLIQSIINYQSLILSSTKQRTLLKTYDGLPL